MPDLTKSQHLILETAATRPDGAILPLPPGLKLRGGARKAALAGLVARGFAAELETKNSKPAWRKDKDKRFALKITSGGHAALKDNSASKGQKPPARKQAGKKTGAGTKCKKPSTSGRKTSATKPRPTTKRDRLIAALQRSDGATIADLQNALAWKPHSVRAALTGLRKQGYWIDRSVETGAGRYRITAINPDALS